MPGTLSQFAVDLGESLDFPTSAIQEMDISFPINQSGHWFVLHTRSRQEKALALDLEARKIPYFLPLRREVRYHGKRKCIVEAPLFAGYLFLKGEVEDTFAADRTKRVAHIIRCPNQRQIEWELININRALLQNAPLLLYPSLVKGIRVEVREGPFQGLQGVIENRLKSNRLMLQVETLGRAVSLEVDNSLLDVIR